MPNLMLINSSRDSATLPISVLYQRRTLDCVVDLVNAISHDFFKRPYNYQNVPDEITNILSEFQTSVGSHPDWPDATQRANISGSILRDLGDVSARLARRTKSLIGKESADNIRNVQYAIVDEVISLRNFLKELDWSVVSIAERQTRNIFQKAVEVLRCEEIAHIFGMSPTPKDDWPFNGVFNVDAAYIIEEISKRLLGSETTLFQQKFIVLQRIAHYAALTIQGVLDESLDWKDPERTNTLFGNASCWAQEIQNLLSNINIIRAWKDPDYRRTLELAELDLLPAHPAGDIVLNSTEFRDIIPENQWREYSPETDVNCTYQCYTHGHCSPQTDNCQSYDPQCKVV
ncbi:mersacidin/lichenicidin family type 2 lantibiotic [Bacillus thuringiensis]|uniref:mersacidin/lichenicidin family type 2 lantibiotic n=1 Tax=Bacillus thuringiensis TaxID=1428 RepID=UPI001C55189E|nr:mersacidin/lichenicidin family type 2 lantibiotic [Bacillus thuringiensis]